MSYAHGYTAYNRIASTMDSRELMLVKLLEGTVRFIGAAREGLKSGDIKMKCENISRTVAIVTELDCALDREMGVSLVENLENLYAYILNRITLANLRNDDQIMAEVESLLITIQDGFVEAFKATSSGMTPHPVSIPYQMESQKGFHIAA